MLLASLTVLISFVVLIWSADRFILGASVLAKHLGLSPLLIGMLVVGFGTSAPELMVSTMASLQNSPQLALGNSFGSNISNIALIVAISAIIKPILVQRRILKEELSGLTAITLLCGLLLLDRGISRLDSLIMLSLFTVLMIWSIRRHRLYGEFRQDSDLPVSDKASRRMGLNGALLNLLLGLGLLVVSSRALVWGAVIVAERFGLSELVIGLTVVAVGTSLPELASSVMAARRGEHEMALGNILGSNIFNTLLIVGVAGVIRPIPVATDVIYRDFPIMLGLTLSLYFFGFGRRGQNGQISRLDGLILLLAYGIYTAYLIVSH